MQVKYHMQMRVLLNNLSAISLIKIKKNNGPKTEPWGTPAEVALLCDKLEPIQFHAK